tara:strand:- start:206 stop:664 length:459 start_codon:yes stop_codon:yes gene_type:complete
MKKQWTELELTIVYYVVKHGAHGAIKSDGGKFFKEAEIESFLGHGKKSYNYCKSRFKTLLGISLKNDEYPGYNPSVLQRAIAIRYQNTTVSQMRVIINKGLEELKKESNDNVLENDKSPLESMKTSLNGKSEPSPGDQLSLDFDTDFYTRFC